MKNFTNSKSFAIFAAFLMTFSTLNVDANNVYSISESKFAEIESRVNSMDYDQLVQARSELIAEQNELYNVQSNTQNPAQNKAVNERLKEVLAELSTIQKALIGLVGAVAISNLTDDGYDDVTPPVITIQGDNPATVELGSTYTDAGATAMDAFHGTTTVTASDNVDTTAVGSYTVTYTATDYDNNTATATRTVNVVDTTDPLFTSSSTFSADENQLAIGTVTVSDLQSVTLSITGENLALSSAGVLSFVSAPDHETVTSFTGTVTATDASSNTATQDITVTVNNLNDITFTTSPNFTAQENQTAIGQVRATGASNATPFSISGSEITITQEGILAFVTAPDYETKTEYTATVTATDADSNTATQDITVTITNDTSDDDSGTATGTGTGTGTSTGTGTGTGTSTGTGTGTGTGTSTGTGTGTGTST